jgi:hypothetical protein
MSEQLKLKSLIFGVPGLIFSVPASYILYIGLGLDGDAGFAMVLPVFLVGLPFSAVSIPIAMASWGLGMNYVEGAEIVLFLSLISIVIGVHINSNFLINFIIKKAFRK